jgi:hypothetical protein
MMARDGLRASAARANGGAGPKGECQDGTSHRTADTGIFSRARKLERIKLNQPLVALAMFDMSFQLLYNVVQRGK